MKTSRPITSGPNVIKDALFGSIATLALFAGPLSLFSYLPGLFYLRRRGIIFAIIIFACGVFPTALYVEAENFMLAIAASVIIFSCMAFAIEQQKGLAESVAMASLGSLAMLGILMTAIAIAADESIIDFWMRHSSEAIDGVLAATTDLQPGEASWRSDSSVEETIDFFNRNRELIIAITPGFAAVSIIIEVWANFMMLRVIDRFGYTGWAYEDISRWRMPGYFIWVTIATLGITITKVPILWEIGLNLLIVIAFAYFLQGMAIVAFYLIKLKFGPLMRSLFYFLIIMPSPLTMIVCGIGLIDFYFDIRRLDAPPKTEEDKEDDSFF